MDRAAASEAARALIGNVGRVIRGKDEAIGAAVTALLAGGHLLVEDVPGVGKTVLGRSIARSISGSFKRVQATPDLLPSDITGTSIYNQDTRSFEFIPGPVFANVVLIDEINRTTPRTQSALLEAMDEAAVTVDGQRHALPEPQFIIATQNPIEHHGTYPLPEGQLDRFAIAMDIGYTTAETEAQLIRAQLQAHPIEDLDPVLSPEEISEIRHLVRETHVDDDVLGYALAIVRATREHPDVEVGGSTRASIMLVRCTQARALIDGRDFVIPDDVKALAVSVRKTRADDRRAGGLLHPGAGTRLTMRLTRKAAIFGLLAALLVVAGSTGQAGWLFVIASGLIGVLGFALFERHRLGDLVIERSVPRRVRVGDGTPVSIAIENPGRRESPPLRLVDRFEPFGTHIYATEPIPPGTTVLIAPELTAESRGVYESGPIEITTGAPFGLKRSKRTIDVPSQTTVVPRWVELRSFPLLEPSSFPRERLHERARIGHSDEIFGTREYRHGDPFRAIHWKSSAHAGHPIVREYQQRSAGRIAIAVWGGEVGEAPDSDLEMLVSSAASIGRYAVSTGHRVAIFHCPSGEVRIARDLTHDAILDELARVRPSADGTKELFEAVTKGAGRGGTVLVHVSTAAAKDLGLRSTINGIGSAGNRVILATARSSTWDPSVVEASMEDLRGACRDVRVLKRHQELRSCLEIY